MPDPRPRLLIIDDEEDLVEALAVRFSASGFEVDTAADGEAGLRKVSERPPDIVLLDLAMPKMDGWEVCRRIRAKAETARLPIVLMTAAILPEVEAKAKRCGADEVVRKPFDDRRLVETVRSRLLTTF